MQTRDRDVNKDCHVWRQAAITWTWLCLKCWDDLVDMTLNIIGKCWITKTETIFLIVFICLSPCPFICLSLFYDPCLPNFVIIRYVVIFLLPYKRLVPINTEVYISLRHHCNSSNAFDIIANGFHCSGVTYLVTLSWLWWLIPLHFPFLESKVWGFKQNGAPGKGNVKRFANCLEMNASFTACTCFTGGTD